MGRAARLRYLLLTAVAALAVAAYLLSMVSDGYEVARIRNSLVATTGTPADFDWTPDAPPPGFLAEDGPVPGVLDGAVDRVLAGGTDPARDWLRARALAEHLVENRGDGQGILSSTVATYRAIREQGLGYCADFTQVMNGLAYAADIPVREWGMSFDGYSGRGHAFSEVYDRALGQWVFMDSFYGFYATDPGTGRPLSALELRERLVEDAATPRIAVQRIRPERFGFKSDAAALEYYRRGADQFFLWFGNNVLSYDAHPLVAALGRVSRALEQGAGILLGVQPGIRLLPTGTNAEAIATLYRTRDRFLVAAALLALLGLAFLALLWRHWRARREDRRG